MGFMFLVCIYMMCRLTARGTEAGRLFDLHIIIIIYEEARAATTIH